MNNVLHRPMGLDKPKHIKQPVYKENPFAQAKAEVHIPDGYALIREKEKEIERLKKQFGLLSSPNKTFINTPSEQGIIPPAPPLPTPGSSPKKTWKSTNVSPMKRNTPTRLRTSSTSQDTPDRTHRRTMTLGAIQSRPGTPINARDLLRQTGTLKQTHIQRSPGGTPVKTREQIEQNSRSNQTGLIASLHSRLDSMRCQVNGDDDSDSSDSDDF
ncbi:hypothetical protein BLNAU_10331 [Blattamonas nauphoetae]|uniref:WH2 domain-containing protein n=1 Tax=Blattamonas nauphoetae TaxID=2049346 RepID=A0ABQ9XT63_9EUKA|nr:hypothetical protein BLNAU_10331 [Blattamonas nauphoetae]